MKNRNIIITDENNRLIDYELIDQSMEVSLTRLTKLLFNVPYSKGLDLDSYNFILTARGVRYKVLTLPSSLKLDEFPVGTIILTYKDKSILINPNDIDVDEFDKFDFLKLDLVKSLAMSENIVRVCRSLVEVYNFKLLII